jgi:hypothetical protein
MRRAGAALAVLALMTGCAEMLPAAAGRTLLGSAPISIGALAA